MPTSELPAWVSVPLILSGTAAVLYQRRHALMVWLGFKEK